MSRNIKFEREFLMETYPEMAEETDGDNDTIRIFELLLLVFM